MTGENSIRTGGVARCAKRLEFLSPRARATRQKIINLHPLRDGDQRRQGIWGEKSDFWPFSASFAGQKILPARGKI
jgi:hypothetical protein